jgi:hypothetical protein
VVLREDASTTANLATGSGRSRVGSARCERWVWYDRQTVGEAEIEIGSFATEAEALAWVSEHTSSVILAAGSRSSLVYSSVWRGTVWLGVKDPSRRFSVQRLFRARLEHRGDAWLLVGRMVLPINSRLNLSLMVGFGIAALGLGLWNAAAGTDAMGAIGPCSLGAAFVAVAWALLAASRRSGSADLSRLREYFERARGDVSDSSIASR